MTTHPSADPSHDPTHPRRRQFLRYMAGSAAAAVALGYLRPAEGADPSLENLCSASPLNSSCTDYLPGVQALDQGKKPILADKLLSKSQSSDRIAVKGLETPKLVYLVITEAPAAIAEYAINPICTHLKCTVDWNPDQNQFVCPCHGSTYDDQGRVVKGPAKRSLTLNTVVTKQNQVRLIDREPAIDPRVKTP